MNDVILGPVIKLNYLSTPVTAEELEVTPPIVLNATDTKVSILYLDILDPITLVATIIEAEASAPIQIQAPVVLLGYINGEVQPNVGPKGDQGDPGPKGDQGDTGPKGDKGDPGDPFSAQNIEISLARKTQGDSFVDITYTGDLPIQYDYWADAAKTIKLFTTVLNYTGTYPTTIITTDEVTGKVQTTTITYAGDKVMGFNEEVV